MLARGGIVARADRRVAHRSEAVELFTLVVAGNERDVDARFADVAAVEPEAGIHVGPTLDELWSVAGPTGAVDADAVDDLDRPAGVNVAAEEDVDAAVTQKPPESLPVRRADREVPVVVLVGFGEVPGGLVGLLHERPVVHHGHVTSRGGQLRQSFEQSPESRFVWQPCARHGREETGESDAATKKRPMAGAEV